jgi:hypothetical protein
LVVSTGDLDGRIFSLSADGNFLLFSRYSNDEGSINSLWLAVLEKETVKIIDLGISNVIHYAEFNQDGTKIAYSTAEWRETAPGWQANNDLYELRIGASGALGLPQIILEPNSGGVYGWWGMDFSWSQDEILFLYSRPDGVGIINESDGIMESIHDIKPYQTGGNWAWVPDSAWSPDGQFVYSVDYKSSEVLSTGETEHFDLIAIPLTDGNTVHLVIDVGMFAYPVPSPIQRKANFSTGNADLILDQSAYSIAYLQALFPKQSESSGYKICLMDRDGSNQIPLFPEEGAMGLEPQRLHWSPEPMSSNGNYSIAFVYNGNIWLIDSVSGSAMQITGDGLTTQIDWR